MKQIIMLLLPFVMVFVSRSNSLYQDYKKDSSRYIYEKIYDEIFQEYEIKISKRNALTYSEKISLYGICECSLVGELLLIKNRVAEIIQKKIPQAAKRALKNDNTLSVYLLPQYDGKIDEVWFLLKNGDMPFKEEEMDLLISEIKKIRLKFEHRADSTKRYCQSLNFGFKKKDWEKIVTQSLR